MPKNYKPQAILICDLSDKFGYLVQLRHFKFLMRHGLTDEEISKVVGSITNFCWKHKSHLTQRRKKQQNLIGTRVLWITKQGILWKYNAKR